jgi:DNA processing protein
MRDPSAFAAALAGLPGMGPASLVRILRESAPEEAWDQVRAGAIARPDDPTARCWSEAARRLDPPSWWAPIARRGIETTWWGDDRYPPALLEDPSPAGVLFWRGRLDPLKAPRVAIVGTRSATPEGRSVAFEIGRDLTAAGVCVISGLALGIDGAAHAGSVRAVADGADVGPVGVAASGVDVPYPTRHAKLWEQVAGCGAVLSETLPGRPAQAWRFPMRNRIIAGLAQMVVVVESHIKGGSLITVEAALERGVEVRAVPGPVRSPASEGSNQLLYDGPGPVRDARDVLDGLGIFRSGPSLTSRKAVKAPPRSAIRPARDPVQLPFPAGSSEQRSPGSADQPAVLEAMGWQSVTVGQIVERAGRAPAVVFRALEELSEAGIVEEVQGWWTRCRH